MTRPVDRLGRRRPAWAAVLALVLVAALTAGGCSVIGGGGDTYRLTAYFDRTINLFASSHVRVLGLPAGTVTDIAIEGDRVRVELELDADVPVPADVQATIVPFSLIGERYVQLFPAWTTGEPTAGDGDVIPLERTSVPVEPDEALAALKEFLDSLDPDGTGRLVRNLGDTLEGQGSTLNSALDNLAGLLGTLADKDQELAGIVDNFDDFTATLVTREGELAEVMDAFAETTSVLAGERRAIEDLVANLAAFSGDAVGLVVEHGTALQRDVEILGRTLRSVDAHLDRVAALLDAGPVLVTGLADAYNPTYHRTDLRNQYSPTVTQLLESIGFPSGPTICLPLDVECTPVEAPAAGTDAVAGAVGPASDAAPPTTVTAGGPPAAGVPEGSSPAVAPRTPVDDILSLVTSPGASGSATVPPEPPAGIEERASSSGGLLARLARSLLGVVA